MTSVLQTDDHELTWNFSAAATAVLDFTAFTASGQTPTSAAIGGGGSVVVQYSGPTFGLGDPYAIASGAWATFTGGGTIQGSSGTIT